MIKNILSTKVAFLFDFLNTVFDICNAELLQIISLGMISTNQNKNLGWYSVVGVAPVNGNFYSWSYQVCEFCSCAVSQYFNHAELTVKPTARKPIQRDQCRAIPCFFPQRRQLQHHDPSADACRAGAVYASAAI
jgi:hypothetical protein